MVAKRLNTEIAVSALNPYRASPVYAGKIRLRSDDQLLAQNGVTNAQTLGVYLDLLRDEHVYYCLNKQFAEITTREYVVEPGGDSDLDKQAADFCQQQLEELAICSDDEDSDLEGWAILPDISGFDDLCRSLLLATLLGVSVVEFVWQRNARGQVVANYFKPRDIRLFEFEEDLRGRVQPRLLTNRNSLVGEPLPARKFVFHRHWAINNGDPLGAGIGKYLYWPVQWRREAYTLWLELLDKHADPKPVGRYPRTATESQIDGFLSDLTALVGRDAALAIQDGFDLTYQTPSLDNADLAWKLVDSCKHAISLAVFGEATTGEAVAGSLDRETVNNSIRVRNAKSWSDSLDNTISSTVFKWLCNWNFPGAKIPRLKRQFVDLDSVLEIARSYRDMGLKPDPGFITEITGVPILVKEQKPNAN